MNFCLLSEPIITNVSELLSTLHFKKLFQNLNFCFLFSNLLKNAFKLFLHFTTIISASARIIHIEMVGGNLETLASYVNCLFKMHGNETVYNCLRLFLININKK